MTVDDLMTLFALVHATFNIMIITKMIPSRRENTHRTKHHSTSLIFCLCVARKTAVQHVIRSATVLIVLNSLISTA
ncbi:hypothetical protein OK016_27840 [Vibrio chagasii]|nr:hypothetical protein [Vibrio chagasii]